MKSSKIISITSVRNEADIIESFVRYTLNIVDRMVINENCSSDNTLDILKKLQLEGLNIDIIKDKNQTFSQSATLNELTDYTMKKYNPDWILPLDADEFIYHNRHINPRKNLSKLNPLQVNLFQWVTYVITGQEENIPFVPQKIKYRRKNEIEKYYKCILSRELFEKGGRLLIGAHNIAFSEMHNYREELNKSIFIAHYPVRSKTQLEQKIITGVLNKRALYPIGMDIGHHQVSVFNRIKKEGKLRDTTLKQISKYYAISNRKEKIELLLDPINCRFCNNIDIKYDESIRDNILGLALETAESIIVKQRNQIKDSELALNTVEELKSELTRISDLLDKTINSKGWKMLERYRGFIRYFKK